MKNVLIVSFGVNYPQCVYSVADEDYDIICPGDQDIAFFNFEEDAEAPTFEEDVRRRLKANGVSQEDFWQRLNSRVVDKRTLQGIQGTLVESAIVEPSYFPNHRERDWEGYQQK